MSATQEQKPIPKAIKFAHGGLAGMGATCIVQPLDLIKNRMQVSKPGQFSSSFACGASIIKNEGIRGIYVGLSAGLLRQISYTTTRLGVYTSLLDSSMAKGKDGTGTPGLGMKILFGMTAGGIGATVGTPAEVALIRMTSDGRLPEAERRNYKNGIDALLRIAREEGVGTLWKGCTPTVGRAMVLNAAQLSSYTQIKQIFMQKYGLKDGLFCHFCSAMCSGFISTVVSMPIDIVKTRIQSMKPDAAGKLPYTGPINCFGSIIKNEGVLSLWKGFTPYYFRLGPHTVFTFIFLEQLIRLYRSI